MTNMQGRFVSSYGLMLAILLALGTVAPAAAKKPAKADETAVQKIVGKIYLDYTRLLEGEGPEVTAQGYVPSYSKALESLIQNWLPVGNGDEVMGMNGFDWYCQCQDYDSSSARLISQRYESVNKNKVAANVRFSPGRGSDGTPLTIYFVREKGGWKLDDLRFDDGSTLRQGLLQDIKDYSRK